jgi:hypothetical protein
MCQSLNSSAGKNSTVFELCHSHLFCQLYCGICHVVYFTDFVFRLFICFPFQGPIQYTISSKSPSSTFPALSFQPQSFLVKKFVICSKSWKASLSQFKNNILRAYCVYTTASDTLIFSKLFFFSLYGNFFNLTKENFGPAATTVSFTDLDQGSEMTILS